MIEDAFGAVVEGLARFINAIAVLVIVIGVIEALIGTLRILANRHATGHERRAVWLDFARWLVAGLTFQLAADIVETTIAPSWEDIGRVAAIAAIRTALTFFLDRDVETIRDRDHGVPSREAA